MRFDNSVDRRQHRKALKEDKARRANLLKAWRAILAQPDGRLVLLSILEYCKVFKSLWEPSAAIHKNEGMRIVGLHILEEIAAADVNALAAMIAEPWLQEARENLEREIAASKPESLRDDAEANVTED